MAGKYVTSIVLCLIVNFVYPWDIPNLPSGKRSQYFLLENDGGYKYGYDTGADYFAKQAGDANNEVTGHYAYKVPSGENIDIKYTAGKKGFIPEGLDKLQHHVKGPYAPSHSYAYSSQDTYTGDSTDDESNTGDATYTFSIDTDTYKRQESSDANGNVQGRYSYTNEAGHHDLTYIAGANSGFVATSGSLSQPNGLEGKSSVPSSSYGYPSSRAHTGTGHVSNISPDGSYSYEFSTNDQSRQESSDPNGNVHGRYSYSNRDGTHDLSYVAGSSTGFQPTGGSLANPNGLRNTPSFQSSPNILHSHQTTYGAGRSSYGGSYTPVITNPDGSWSYSYTTGDQSRQESSDGAGNVHGTYSYRNKDGSHDLSYVAGAQTGFLPTGGSLATPNGIRGSADARTYSGSSRYAPQTTDYSSTKYASGSYTPVITNPDGSYSFSYSTDDQSRQESADRNGNVQGRYAYRNNAGTHDLSYVAGSKTGFLPTGGSLAIPNGLGSKSVPIPSTYSHYVPPSETYSGESNDDGDDQANTGDASYSFTIDTDDYKRQETSDASGNVRGSFSYRNSAGDHDLSFVSGSETGFLPVGGTLSKPNGLEGKEVQPTSYIPSESYYPVEVEEPEEVVNVRNGARRFGLTNVPSGVVSNRFGGPSASPEYLPPEVKPSDFLAMSKSKTSSRTKVGNTFLKTYYPSKSQSKYGYIFESL